MLARFRLTISNSLFLNFNCISRLKAIKKQMSHVKAETEEEKDDVKELGQDLLRRHEQLAQVGI